LARLVADNDVIKNLLLNYGYPGLFLASVISGFNILVPIPIVSFLPLLLEAGLNYWLTVLVISLGVTGGDMLSYLVGRVGREISKQGHIERAAKLKRFAQRFSIAPLFILFLFAAFVPFPNEIIVIPLAFLGYQVKKVLPVALAGNLVFNYLASQGFIGLYDFLF